MGHQAIMRTILVVKVEMAFPAMNMMQRFLGICLRGLKATSQPFTRILSVSCTLVSSTCLSK
uniref:Uncharacterized protein n=1 Tax=Spermophilus dauricus TaxID=99837 RepID=A0A8C9PTP7_SPEDA